MHEMALCESLIGVIEDQAAVHQYTRVKTVFLEIGPLSCVAPEALRFSFDVAARGTLAEGAVLEIAETRPQFWCRACDHAVSPRRPFDPCPDCGGTDLQISGGEDLRIKQLEVA